MGPALPYGRIARFYDLLDSPFEYGRYRRLRRILFAGVHGKILDVGVGTGRNMAFYPQSASVTGIDLSAEMLARAASRQERLRVTAELEHMDVRSTRFPSGHFDFVIASFLFCVLDDDSQLPALRELGRITAPGGEIRLLDYVYSRKPWRRFVMRLWAPLVRRLYGAAFDRDTRRLVGPAGLELVEERFLVGDIIKLLVLRPR